MSDSEQYLRLSAIVRTGMYSDTPTGRTIQEHWDRQDAKQSLAHDVLSLQSKIAIAGKLSAYATAVDSEQVWRAIDYLHGLQ